MIAGAGGILIVLIAVAVVLIWNQTSKSPSVADADLDKAAKKTVKKGSSTKSGDQVVPLNRAKTDFEKKNEELKELDSPAIFEKFAPSVALVKGKHGSGSGFLLPGNIVVTNHHVVQGEFIEDVEVKFPSAQGADRGPFKVELLYEKQARDIAFLRLLEDCNLPPLAVADPVEYRPGMAITCIGSPGRSSGEVIQNDVVSGTLRGQDTLNDQMCYTFAAAVWHGNSGGPMFDKYGRVIGIVTAGDSANKDLNFAIPADQILIHFAQTNQRDAEMQSFNGSQHRMRALAMGLLKAAQVYNSFFAWFVQSSEEAKKEGLEEADILKKRAQQQEQTLKEIEKLLPSNVTEIIDTVKADKNVPDDVKESFQQYLDSYNAIRDFFHEIKGKESPTDEDYKEIKKKQRELFQKQQEIWKKLAEGLDKVLE